MKQIIAIFFFIFALASCNTKSTCDCADCATKCKTEVVTDSTAVPTETEVETPTEVEPAEEETK